jgi:hypothetical protein
MPRTQKSKDPHARIRELERKVERLERLLGARRHIGSITPTGGRSGEMAVGNNKLWANDRGTWKGVTIT